MNNDDYLAIMLMLKFDAKWLCTYRIHYQNSEVCLKRSKILLCVNHGTVNRPRHCATQEVTCTAMQQTEQPRSHFWALHINKYVPTTPVVSLHVVLDHSGGTICAHRINSWQVAGGHGTGGAVQVLSDAQWRVNASFQEGWETLAPASEYSYVY